MINPEFGLSAAKKGGKINPVNCFVGRKSVLRIDGAYLYRIGHQIHQLDNLKWGRAPEDGSSYFDALVSLLVAEGALEDLLNRSVYTPRTSQSSGVELLKAIRELKKTVLPEEDRDKRLTFSQLYPITTALQAFETVFGAELSIAPLYLVTRKAAFETDILIFNGTECFPKDVITKVPLAVPDLTEGTRCLAFELFTASGFHFHRANETVLGFYWDAVTDGKTRPKSRNMGDYLNGLDAANLGDARARSALRELKDLHRNPLIHPETSIEDADDAIALMGCVHAAIVWMLKEIPAPPQAVRNVLTSLVQSESA